MGRKAMRSAGTLQVFREPSQASAIFCVVVAQLIFAVFAGDELASWEFSGSGLVLATCCIGCVAVFFQTYLQETIIEGRFVQVRNSTTLFRWRRFDVSEVERVRFLFAESNHQFQEFQILLKPAPSRAWTEVRLKTHDAAGKYKGIDAPVMLAFMLAVTTVRPDIKLENLPQEHSERYSKTKA